MITNEMTDITNNIIYVHLGPCTVSLTDPNCRSLLYIQIKWDLKHCINNYLSNKCIFLFKLEIVLFRYKWYSRYYNQVQMIDIGFGPTFEIGSAGNMDLLFKGKQENCIGVSSPGHFVTNASFKFSQL